MDAGDLATWVGSSFAAVAAGATLWTLKSQRDQIGEQRAFIGEQSATMALERAALAAAAEDRKWAQARQVGVSHDRLPESGGARWFVDVSNRSDSPITDVRVRFGEAYVALEMRWLHAVGTTPGHSRVGEGGVHPLHLLGPGRSAQFRSQVFRDVTAHSNRPTVIFTDDSGVRWVLDSYGKLEEAPPDLSA